MRYLERTLYGTLIGLCVVLTGRFPREAVAEEQRSGPPPRIELLPKRTEKGEQTIKLVARLVDEDGGGIGTKVSWRVNGRDLVAIIASEIRRPISVGDYVVIEQTLTVDPSKVNEIEIVAYNGEGLRASQPYRFRVGPWTVANQEQRPPVFLFHGSRSGEQTLDQGDGGGNPFASALIDILGRPSVMLSELPAAIEELTKKKSKGRQAADVPRGLVAPDWPLVPQSFGEIALVLVISDYSKIGPTSSLSGARHDAGRIARALADAGFVTEIALDLDLPGMRRRLGAFAARSTRHDAALVYTTGHGVEVGGNVFLLPGDYSMRQRTSGLAKRGLPLSEIAKSARAKRINLIFYGGCRDNPWPGDVSHGQE